MDLLGSVPVYRSCIDEGNSIGPSSFKFGICRGKDGINCDYVYANVDRDGDVLLKVWETVVGLMYS